MTTRSFIKSLALLSGAAVGCPGIFIPKFEPVRWKVNRYIRSGGNVWKVEVKAMYFIHPGTLFDPAPLLGKWTWRDGGITITTP